MKQSFFIPGPLPGLNDVIAMAKRHWAQYAKEKAYWTDLVAWTCKGKRIKPVKMAFIEFTWIEKGKRRDPDNIAMAKKFILDGMVHAGVLENDGWGQIAGWSDEFKIDKARPGVEVTLK